MNSQLTEQYKKDVSDILSKIGEGLGETVLEGIEPKIASLSKNSDNLYSTINQFKEHNLVFSKAIQEDFINELQDLKKEIGSTSEFEKLNISIGSLKNKILESTTNLNEYSNKSMLHEFRVLTDIVKNQDAANEVVVKLNDIKNTQEKVFLDINNFKQVLNESLTSEFQNVSQRLSALESNKLEEEVLKNQRQLRSLTKLNYAIIIILIVCFITILAFSLIR